MAILHSSSPGEGTATCFNLLRRLFPGLDAERRFPYLAFPSPNGTEAPAYRSPPVLPPDVFAAAAHLLDLSGAYHHVIPFLPRSEGPRNDGRAEERARGKRLILIEKGDIKRARAVARAWRAFHPDLNFKRWIAGDGSDLKPLFLWWDEVFIQSGHCPVFKTIPSDTPPPMWWKSAVMLLTAADEASVEVGYPIHVADEKDDTPWISKMIEGQIAETFDAQGARIGAPPQVTERFTAVSSISFADQDMVAVLPKDRTTSVVCTLRSLSHHLALLPPRGVARASWIPYLFHRPPPDEQNLNLLLIPFPFSIPAGAFRPAAYSDGEGSKWGFFGVEQTWLQGITVEVMLEFIQALAEEASRECDGIDGVVFPELALNHELYEGLSERLPEILPRIELLVAGQSGDPKRRLGNFVAVTVYQDTGESRAKRHGLVTRREKHHRWRLDRHQILSYGLEGMLSPSLGWWEDIDLLSRRVDFSVFRAHSVFSAMICEDLARVDPCQELLRSVGPSLIFALLMDAPQFQARWPGRYATVLAEDPGTAVLTLTSRALMTRQHRLGLKESTTGKDRVIALWRDDGGEYVEIECPQDAQAVRLTLSGQPSIDITLDGRDDRTATSWRYAARRAISIPDAKSRFKDILGLDEMP